MLRMSQKRFASLVDLVFVSFQSHAHRDVKSVALERPKEELAGMGAFARSRPDRRAVSGGERV
eukprot:7005633-Pyramimonas_sp.AAC.1